MTNLRSDCPFCQSETGDGSDLRGDWETISTDGWARYKKDHELGHPQDQKISEMSPNDPNYTQVGENAYIKNDSQLSTKEPWEEKLQSLAPFTYATIHGFVRTTRQEGYIQGQQDAMNGINPPLEEKIKTLLAKAKEEGRREALLKVATDLSSILTRET